MKTLRSRLTFTHALVAILAIVIVAGLSTWLIRRGFDEFAESQARTTATAVAERLSEYYATRGSWAGIQLALRNRANADLQASIQNRRIQVYDADNRLLFDSARLVAPTRPILPIPGVRVPITVGGQPVGSVLVGMRLEDTTPAERDLLGRVYISMIIGSLIGGGVALGIGLVIAGRVSRPLRQLRQGVHRLINGERHEPLPIPPDAELAEVTQSFNGLAAELEHQQQLRRRLVADIAHELRTPLSVLQIQVEALEDGVEQPGSDTYRSLHDEIRLLSGLVSDLQFLAHADSGQIALNIQPLNACDAVRQIVNNAQVRARQQQITLLAELPETPLMIAADPQRLAQILTNLVENALRYTPAGGEVRMRAAAMSGSPGVPQLPISARLGHAPRLPPPSSWAVIDVRDSGPGIAPDDLERVFERFYRTDPARARHSGGSGLGLSIVKQLVELQHGRVWASSAPGSGATFSVAFPRDPQQ